MDEWDRGGVQSSCEVPANWVASSLSVTSPLLDFTLRCGEPGQEVKCSKILLACNCRTLRESFDKDPSLVEVVLPSLNPEAVAAVCGLLTEHKLELSWGQLGDICAVVNLLQVPVAHCAMREAAEKLFIQLDPSRKQEAYFRTKYMVGPAVQQKETKSKWERCDAFLRNLLDLGLQYNLPCLVEVGIDKSLVHVPGYEQAAHFKGLPESMMTRVSALRMMRGELRKLHNRFEPVWATLIVLFLIIVIWLIILCFVKS